MAIIAIYGGSSTAATAAAAAATANIFAATGTMAATAGGLVIRVIRGAVVHIFPGIYRSAGRVTIIIRVALPAKITYLFIAVI